MSDVLKNLPKFRWRGITVPLLSCKGSFEQDDVIHKFEFRDRELLESQGVKNWRFTYTIPFREEITKAPYSKLFSSVLPDFILACRDRTPGPLYDPILGSFRAKVANFSLDTDVNKRDGSDVTVDFIEAPEIGEIDDFVAVHDVTDKVDARSIDDAVTKVDWKQVEPPPPTVDALDALDGFLRQVQSYGNRLNASLESYTFKLSKVEDSLNALGDPTQWQLRASVRRARYDALVQALTQEPGGSKSRIGKKITNGGPVSSVAQSVKMNTQAFLALNQELSRMPLVPQGTEIRYIRAA
jgi:hypothetical protein